MIFLKFCVFSSTVKINSNFLITLVFASTENVRVFLIF